MEPTYFCHLNSPAVQGWLRDERFFDSWMGEFNWAAHEYEAPDYGDFLPTPEQFAELPKATPPARIFHYTDLLDLPRFLDSRVIDIYAENQFWPQRTWVASCSSNLLLERGCAVYSIRGPGSFGGDSHGSGRYSSLANAVRIEVRPEAAPYSYVDFLNWCAMPCHIIDSLEERSSFKFGNPREWYCSPAPIPASEWLGIEVWDMDQLRWIPLAQSTDLQILELVLYLPADMLPPGFAPQPAHALRYQADARPNKLLNIPAALHQAGFPVEPPYGDRDDFESIMTGFVLSRELWLGLSRMAAMGFKFMPLDKAGQSKLPGGALPSSDLCDIRRWFLDEQLENVCGIVLSAGSTPVFGLRVNADQFSMTLDLRLPPLPPTIHFSESKREFLCRHDVHLFSAPQGLLIPWGRHEFQGGHVIEVIPPGSIYAACGQHLTHSTSNPYGKSIAKAPPWLLALVRGTLSSRTDLTNTTPRKT